MEDTMSEERKVKYYRIVRFYHGARINRRIISTTNSLAVAQAHCNNPESSYKTCTSKVGRARTRRLGAWFDGYEKVY
jgi:hypothetical protein